jgi:hypothetical protein
MRQTTTAELRHDEGKQQVLSATRRDESILLPAAPVAVRPWQPKNQTIALACPAIRAKILS